MKTSLKSTLIALSLLAVSGMASAASDKPATHVEDYSYSSKLDIAKVVSAPDLGFCGVQPVQMTYQDHSGVTHTVRYEEIGSGCNMG
ncbi:MAG: putative secreted protein [Pseudomonas sp.]|nr:putative secreted protein [Pseudomonas sp.]